MKACRDAEYGLSCAHKHHRLSDKSANLSSTHFPHHTMEESKSRISEALPGLNVYELINLRTRRWVEGLWPEP